MTSEAVGEVLKDADRDLDPVADGDSDSEGDCEFE